MERRDRQEAERHGRRAETLCALLLRLKGYRILARHWRCPSGEIDIVARRGRAVAFIEVKARDALGVAADAISPRQRQRIARAAEHFLKSRPDLRALEPRFDVMLVTPGRLPRHLANAWMVAS